MAIMRAVVALGFALAATTALQPAPRAGAALGAPRRRALVVKAGGGGTTIERPRPDVAKPLEQQPMEPTPTDKTGGGGGSKEYCVLLFNDPVNTRECGLRRRARAFFRAGAAAPLADCFAPDARRFDARVLDVARADTPRARREDDPPFPR